MLTKMVHSFYMDLLAFGQTLNAPLNELDISICIKLIHDEGQQVCFNVKGHSNKQIWLKCIMRTIIRPAYLSFSKGE